jgi:Cu-processing system permease protein
MNAITTITWLTFHEARRRRMVLAAALMGIGFLALYGLGLRLISQELANNSPSDRFFVLSFVTFAGLYVIHFLTVMLTIFASVDTIAGEITTHTIQTLAVKPLARWQIVLGKWLGYALMLSPYVLLLSGGVVLLVYLNLGYLPPNMPQALGLLVLESLVLLSLSLLFGTRLSTLANGVVLFMIYGLTFIGSWVEQIGALLQSAGAVRVGIFTSLLMPVEALWRRTAYLLQPAIVRDLPTPFTTSSVPSPAMIVFAVVYAAVALLLAMRSLSRRDL